MNLTSLCKSLIYNFEGSEDAQLLIEVFCQRLRLDLPHSSCYLSRGKESHLLFVNLSRVEIGENVRSLEIIAVRCGYMKKMMDLSLNCEQRKGQFLKSTKCSFSKGERGKNYIQHGT